MLYLQHNRGYDAISYGRLWVCHGCGYCITISKSQSYIYLSRSQGHWQLNNVVTWSQTVFGKSMTPARWSAYWMTIPPIHRTSFLQTRLASVPGSLLLRREPGNKAKTHHTHQRHTHTHTPQTHILYHRHTLYLWFILTGWRSH